jgi:AcrR family transcriptional regulator
LDKKQEIIDAAFELFSIKGDHLSVAELARAVGIKTPSLYSHFESKDQIMEVMIRREIHRYYECLEQEIIMVENRSCKQAMQRIFDFAMEYFGESKQLRFWRTMPLIANEQNKSIFRQLIERQENLYIQRMKRCFQRGLENGEIRPDVSESALDLYFTMIQGVLDIMPLRSIKPNQNGFAANVFESYWKGICAEPSAQKGTL